MLYKVIKKFGPSHEEKWRDYTEWRGLTHLKRFDSVDSVLRPDLFEPETADDWRNCVNADFKLNLITDLQYARGILSRHEDCDLVGVEVEVDSDYKSQEGCLGFDIIDEYCATSLLTNWGTDEEGITGQHIEHNALVADLQHALRIRDILRERFPKDGHAANCEAWAIYGVDG